MDGLSLGPLVLRWNGLLLALGISMGALIAAREAKRSDYDPEIIYYLFLPLTIWGAIGARLWHIFTPPLSSVQLGLTTQYYLSHPVDSLALWIGGFGIPGALIGGILALLYFAQRNELSFWKLADILAPGLALAQAIGRLGNYFNQELYGLPTNLPWKIFIEPAYRLIGYEGVEYYHPLFAYEIILSFVNLFFLFWLARRFAESLKTGDLFLAYLGVYSLVRFLLEFLRLDVVLINGININQVFFAITFVSAILIMSLRGGFLFSPTKQPHN
jgi:phosphatidylglycerol---prolipoprotein diacylglyceryl transferase